MSDASGCPRCGTYSLYAVAVRGRTAHACRRCGGVWLGRTTAALVDDALERSSVEAAKRAARDAVSTEHAPRALTCPKCSRALEPHFIAGVEIDSCEAHGTWYDREELPQIAERLGGRRTSAAASSLLVAGAAVPAAAALSSGALADDAEPRERVAREVAEVGADSVDLMAVVTDLGSGMLEVVGTVAEASLSLVGDIFGALF